MIKGGLEMSAKQNETLLAAWISLLSNLFLTIIKIAVGMVFSSPVLVADGVHNAADVMASVASLGSIRIANRPADKEHPYGYGKAEVIASAIVAIILGFAAVWIASQSIKALFEPATEVHVLAFIAAVISTVWKQALYVYTIRVGKRNNSMGLIATAYDHLADVYASIAAVVGIGLGLIGQYYDAPFAAYGDPVAGIIVAVFVLKMAFEMAKESVQVLMEGSVSPEKLEEYASLVKSFPQVKRIDRLRARTHGQYILVDVRIGVPADLSIQEGHDVSKSIRQLVMKEDTQVKEVLIHLNPWYEEDGDKKVVEP